MVSPACPRCHTPLPGLGTVLLIARAKQVKCPKCGARAHASFGQIEQIISRFIGASLLVCMLAIPIAHEWLGWATAMLTIAFCSVPIFAVLCLRSPLTEIQASDESPDRRLWFFIRAGIFVWYAIALFVKANQLH